VSSPPDSEDLSLNFISSTPQQFGVLSDLAVLDTIIGQGVSQDMVEALAKIQSISSTWEASDTTGGSVTAPSNVLTEEDAKTALGKVFGNSAFLISTPIRIVFSSLFMVDGFITGSAVQFSKFSENLVPTMCAINLTVEAKYIGFARKQTYLTTALQSMTPNPNAGGTPPPTSRFGDTEEYQYLVSLVKKLPKYQISLSGIDADDHSNNWNGSSKSWYEIMHYDKFLQRNGFVGNPEDADIYRELQRGNYSISIKHTPLLYVYRGYANEAERASAQATGITRSYQPTLAEPGAGGTANKSVKLISINSNTVATITDAASWKRLARYGGGGATEDANYDNRVNDVWANAKAQKPSIDKKEANNLYLDLPSYSNVTDTAKRTRLLIEYKLLLEVKLWSSKTVSNPSVLYIEQTGTRTEAAAAKAGFTFAIDPTQAK
jgi:hypothetical protein